MHHERTPLVHVPYAALGIDLFHYQNDQYLIMADRYSGFVWTAKMSPVTTRSVSDQRFSCGSSTMDSQTPSDQTGEGAQFPQTFDSFCKDHEIAYELASAHHPESTDLAEVAVKSVTFLLEKNCLIIWRKFQCSMYCQPSDRGHELMATAQQKHPSSINFGVASLK